MLLYNFHIFILQERVLNFLTDYHLCFLTFSKICSSDIMLKNFGWDDGDGEFEFGAL